MVDYDLLWFIVLVIIGTALISLGIFHIVFGQDIDPKGYCFYKNQHPFSQLCKEQMLRELFMEKWNFSQLY